MKKGFFKKNCAIVYGLILLVFFLYCYQLHFLTFDRAGASDKSEVHSFTKEKLIATEVTSIVEFAALQQRNNLVILTYVSYGYKENLMNWLSYLQKLEISNYGIICLDEEVELFLTHSNITCFGLWRQSEVNDSFGDSKQGLSIANVMKLWVIRMRHLYELLNHGFDVIFSDTDAVWLRNPLSEGTSLLSEQTGDIVASRGKFPWEQAKNWGATICMGLSYFRSTPSVIEIVREATKVSQERFDDQVGINVALDTLATRGRTRSAPLFSNIAARTGVKVGFLRDRENAEAHVAGAKVVLIPHQVVPRCCNALTPEDWKKNVQIAHCHATDCVKARTRKENWGNFDRRYGAMKKYNLWNLT
mmetsp:Transcript_12732/g.14852  ORF Transcript_12732/g.14852 Transcript_12732/m.14852 type:complete len:360 (+) Transcript_12732:39-1118(+)